MEKVMLVPKTMVAELVWYHSLEFSYQLITGIPEIYPTFLDLLFDGSLFRTT